MKLRRAWTTLFRMGPDDAAMRRIIVGFDGSEEARDALCFASRLARLEGSALAVAVVGLFEPQTSSEAERIASADSRRAIFAAVSEELGSRTFEPRVIEGLPVAQGLLRLAEDEEADLIVVGSTHRGGAGRVFPGSVGAQLFHGSPCPVAIVPKGFRSAEHDVRGVLGVAYDGSREAELALAEAVHLARLLDVDLRLIAVVPPVELLDIPRAERNAQNHRRRREWEALLEHGAAMVPGDLEAETRLQEGEPGGTLTTSCRELDALVLGSRGRGRLGRTLLGSVSAHLCCNAECPVVVVPRGAEPTVGSGDSEGSRLSANV